MRRGLFRQRAVDFKMQQKKVSQIRPMRALKSAALSLFMILSPLSEGLAKADVSNTSRQPAKVGRVEKTVKFDTVSIAEMKKWNEETKKYRVLGEARLKTGFSTLVKVQFNGSEFIATGLVDYTGKHGTKLSFKYKDSKGKTTIYPDLDLSSLTQLYKKQTGKNITSFEIVVEKGRDKTVGDYIQFWVVPNGEIKPKVPVLATYGYAQGNVGISNKPDLLAYAK